MAANQRNPEMKNCIRANSLMHLDIGHGIRCTRIDCWNSRMLIFFYMPEDEIFNLSFLLQQFPEFKHNPNKINTILKHIKIAQTIDKISRKRCNSFYYMDEQLNSIWDDLNKMKLKSVIKVNDNNIITSKLYINKAVPNVVINIHTADKELTGIWCNYEILSELFKCIKGDYSFLSERYNELIKPLFFTSNQEYENYKNNVMINMPIFPKEFCEFVCEYGFKAIPFYEKEEEDSNEIKETDINVPSTETQNIVQAAI